MGQNKTIKKKRVMQKNLIVLGSQWGDEGKAKIVDLLADSFNIIGRFQGGGNAGHTVIIGDRKIIFHIIPSGIVRPDKYVFLGNGMVIDPPALLDEMDKIEEQGMSFGDRLIISRRAHVIMPYHKSMEQYSENKLKGKKIGTTMRGIGPAYEDKIARRGIMISDLLDEKLLRWKLEQILAFKNEMLECVYKLPSFTSEQIIAEYRPAIERIRRFVKDGVTWLNNALDNGQRLLCEGAQGTHLDIDHGTYPFVTSSNSSAGGALTGLGLGPRRFHHVIGVVKAYVTRVGKGPFPSEDTTISGEKLRNRGYEFGSTTGRPRRCGWFDVPVMKYSANVNGLTALAITKLDVLTGIKKIKICHQYRYGENDIINFPEDPVILKNCKAEYIEVDGWEEDISNAKSWNDLPDNAQRYIKKIEELIGIEVTIVSVGPERTQYFFMKESKFYNDFYV